MASRKTRLAFRYSFFATRYETSLETARGRLLGGQSERDIIDAKCHGIDSVSLIPQQIRHRNPIDESYDLCKNTGGSQYDSL